MIESILDILLLIVKIGLGCLFAYAILLVALHLRSLNHLNFYEKQGAVVYPGARRFFFGNSIDFGTYGKVRANSTAPVKGPYEWMIFEYFPKLLGFPEGKKFAANEYPILATSF